MNLWDYVGEAQPLTVLPLGAHSLLQEVLSPGDMTTMIIVGLVLGAAMFMLDTLAQGALIEMVGSLQHHQEATITSGLRAGVAVFFAVSASRQQKHAPGRCFAVARRALVVQFLR